MPSQLLGTGVREKREERGGGGVSPRGNSGVGRRQHSASGGSPPAIYATIFNFNLLDDIIVEAWVTGVGDMGSALALSIDGKPRSGQSAQAVQRRMMSPQRPQQQVLRLQEWPRKFPGGQTLQQIQRRRQGKKGSTRHHHWLLARRCTKLTTGARGMRACTRTR